MRPFDLAWQILKEQCGMTTYEGIRCDRPAVYQGMCKEHAADLGV